MFCKQCGKEVDAGDRFCCYCGASTENRVVVPDSQINQSQQVVKTEMVPVPQQQIVNSQQLPEFNLNSFVGKTYRGRSNYYGTIFYKDRLQYGKSTYLYSDLTEITINNMPTTAECGYASSVYTPENKTFIMSFFNDANGFINAVEYANSEIEKTGSSCNGRLFLLKSLDGYKLGVFDDYISIKAKGNTRQANGNGNRIIFFQDITSMKITDENMLEIEFNNESELTQIHIPYVPSDISLVNDIVSYINNHTTRELSPIDEEVWKFVVGSAKEFPLLGKTLTVNEELDTFNSYRTMYMKCAAVFSQQLKKKYFQQIYDFDSFMKLYLPLYREQLDKLINKTNDILVSASIWTETSESIMQRHVENYHLALDDYTVMYDSLMATVRNNKERVASITSFVPNLVGGGFGIGGALKGIAAATAFNLVRDGAEAALIDNANIRTDQKIELYSRINLQLLFERAFLDMWRMFITLTDILEENGIDIYTVTDENSAKADNIMKNVSNPNFPQEQFPDVMVTVIGMNPYKKELYEFLIEKGADENEVKAIREYFGYTDQTPIYIS